MTERSDIVEVVEAAGVALRRAGRELTGLCPFHLEKIPSFTVNREKGVFHCFGCGEGGDLISFIRKLHGIGFGEALKLLNIEGGYKPSHEQVRRRDEARRIAEWARALSIKLRDKLLDIGNRAHLCRKVQKCAGADVDFLKQEEQRLRDEWSVLTMLDDDLNRPALVEMFRSARADIEALMEGLA